MFPLLFNDNGKIDHMIINRVLSLARSRHQLIKKIVVFIVLYQPNGLHLLSKNKMVNSTAERCPMQEFMSEYADKYQCINKNVRGKHSSIYNSDFHCDFVASRMYYIGSCLAVHFTGSTLSLTTVYRLSTTQTVIHDIFLPLSIPV